jgi:hypothetical protein
MDYVQRLRQLDTEETTELTDLREHGRVLDREIETAMNEVRRAQNVIVRLTQKKASLKEAEEAVHRRFKQQRDDLHEREKMELRRRQANGKMEVELVGRGGTVARRIPAAPPHTPRLRCFLQHLLVVEEHDLHECYVFLTMSNPDRVKLFTTQHRCFGCFLPTALVAHELNRCPHRRYCAICKTPDHHQVLCAPRQVYDEALPGSG